jgi:glycosyltransferase involved in cell wall biosynthesis
MQRIIIIGTAHPLRGGLAVFNQRLAVQFLNEGDDCSIVSFSLQYPRFLFPGTTQYTDSPPPDNIKIQSLINSVNPFNWIKVGHQIKKWKPDIVVVRFWLPLMAPALGTILRLIKKNRHTKIICLVDNMIPHEKRPGDTPFTKYFVPACDAFITMSEKVLKDLRRLELKKPAILVSHPLSDSFGSIVPKHAAREILKLPDQERIILFFGFIRQYKGLDLLLKAMADERIKNTGIRLLVAGEFYEDEKPYLELIEKEGLQNSVILHTSFIPDAEVKNYLCAADCVVQPYKTATQSGVTPLAYHFEKPMIVTNVGGLPDLVPHERTGLICEPDPHAIADAILRFYQLGEQYFIPHLRSEKQKYSWANLTSAIRNLAAPTASGRQL